MKHLLLFSDHPASLSGLGRITRDLALRVHHHLHEFKVATLGYGSPGSKILPFQQYSWKERDDFLPVELPYIWNDFARGDGILMTIGDVQRFLPVADHQFAQDRNFAQWMKEARESGRLKLWGYFPIDAHNKDGKLGPQLGHTLSHYDRILVPSNWAARIVNGTLPDAKVDVLPHGIDGGVFHPHPREASRDQVGYLLGPSLMWPQSEVNIPEDALWIGIVATNQWRKDWALGIETVAELAKSRPVFLWCHSDKLKHEWNILELLSDFGLLGSSMVSIGNLADSSMAVAYSACDLTLGIGRGEGFGYPIFESAFCGTPCFADSYGAHFEYMNPLHTIHAERKRTEGVLNLLRPVGRPEQWAMTINENLEANPRIPDELDWMNLWPRFAQWFREGIQ